MRRALLTTITTITATTTILSSLLLAGAAYAHGGGDKHHSSINVSFDGPLSRCSDIDAHFGGRPIVVRREESVPLPNAATNPVRIRASRNGGIHVQPLNGRAPSIVACELAAGTDENEARATLEGIHPEQSGAEWTVRGPDNYDWVAYIIVFAPDESRLELTANNGELSISSLNGTFVLRTTNGPISLDGVSGEIDAAAKNGPIDFTGHSGKVGLRAVNGPISVKLTGEWSGAGLAAATRNGPVSLEVPQDLRTGVRIEASKYSPFDCEIDACERGNDRTLSVGKRRDNFLQFGTEPVRIVLETKNGPLSIKPLER